MYAKEYGLQLQLEYPDSVCVTEEGGVIPGKKDKESSQETSRIKRTGGERTEMTRKAGNGKRKRRKAKH